MKTQTLAFAIIAAVFTTETIAQQTSNYLSKFSTPPSLVNSSIFDDGTKVGIGASTGLYEKLFVNGAVYSNSTATNTIYSGNGGDGANFVGTGRYWALRTNTSYNFNLDVYNGGSPKTALTVLQNGNFGVGITSPQAPLDVLYTVRASGASPSSGYSTINGGNATYTGYIEWMRPNGVRTAYIGFDNDNNLGMHLENSANFTITGGGGRVGIGTSTPISPLDVWRSASNGSIMRIGTGHDGGQALDITAVQTSAANGYYAFDAGASASGWQKIVFSNSKIGIGTTAPSALLHVKDGSVLFTGVADDLIAGGTPTSGTGSRMMWIPGKGAFRAGVIDFNAPTQWDDINIGYFSFASGINTKAKGPSSFAGGYSTTASGFCSTAFGNYNVSSGAYSFVSGEYTTASGITSTAFGSSTLASGNASTAFGDYTTASGSISTAFGDHSIAQSYNSFVLGRYNSSSGNPTAWVDTDALFVIGNGTSTIPSNAVTVLKNGNTGIGTATPVANAKLDVNGSVAISAPRVPTDPISGQLFKLAVGGKVLATEYVVRLTQDWWPDYVFNKEYDLKDLNDLEKYVKENKHLPEIPSAKEVEANGLSVSDMLTRHMKKIEELTLYMIRLNNEVQTLKSENAALKASIKK